MNEKVIKIPVERIERTILVIRNQKVILDADLAKLYGVTTKRLNQQVKRNRDRFPEDFMFQLTSKEKIEVVANCDHLSRLKFSPASPYAFTEHGAIMAASVLNTSHAIEVSIFVVRAFVKFREMLTTHKELTRNLAELESRLQDHDEQIQTILEAIRQLMSPPERPRKKIGFEVKERKAIYSRKKKMNKR
ncbi:MAG: ORF6N domain-containing protein [Deltaproteobacteria bacterium]|nr:ORF6N domain-containing protein [Deltaproteobacteria bacterium]MBL7177836.1 ORF6N domain-containing protein [Desulfobacteraceae bacterium]